MLATIKRAIHDYQDRSLYNSTHSFNSFEDSSPTINISTITSILRELGQPQGSIRNDAQYIFTSAHTLFKILLHIDQEQQILKIASAGWSDTFLPVTSTHDSSNSLSTYVCNSLPADQQSFMINQWRFLCPPLTELGQHFDLHESCVLPFIKGHTLKHIDEHNSIYSARLCQYQNNHHLDNDFELLVAIKQFCGRDVGRFLHEREMLLQLAPLQEEHVIRLLASYSHHGRHFIMLPLASCDLFQFWVQNDPFTNTDSHIRWFVGEITGIMDSLRRMHSMQDLRKVHSTSQLQGIFHGDIHPGNILVMQDSRLVLNDFGLSAWTNDPPFLETTRTYESPEYQLSSRVGPSSDVWSFGCVVFEGLIWLLFGNEIVDRFSQDRILATPGSNLPFKDDHFFMLRYEDGKPVDAIIRETVKKYSDDMRKHERCVGAIKELLDIVTEFMLVVDHEKRGTAKDMATMFRGVSERLDREEMLDASQIT